MVDVILLHERVAILYEWRWSSRVKRIVWKCWSILSMLHHAWWGMLKIGIRHRIGIHVIVLRLPIMARRIVTRHYFGKSDQGKVETWLKLMLRADGKKVAVIGTHVIQGPERTGVRRRSPVFDKRHGSRDLRSEGV